MTTPHLVETTGTGTSLQPIATAPELERVMVAGWEPRHGNVQGYWWWEEDVILNGKAFEKPFATHWFPIVLPEFPDHPLSPEQEVEKP